MATVDNSATGDNSLTVTQAPLPIISGTKTSDTTTDESNSIY